MNRTNMYQPTYEIPRDPGMAAMLSIIPGLGQLYNGEKRKGVLFLDVAAINFVLMWMMLFTDPIIKAMKSFGQTFHVQPNKTVVESLQAAHIGSPLSIIVLGLIVTFAAYAVRDAYDRANVTRRRKIYPDAVVEMPEATSGSYLFHFAAMISLFVLALFFVQPVKNETVTVIEFVYDQPETKDKVKEDRQSDHNSKNAGRVNPNKAATSSASDSQRQQVVHQQTVQPPAAVQPTRVSTPQPPTPVRPTRVNTPQPPTPVQPTRVQPQQVAMLPPVRPVQATTPAQPVLPTIQPVATQPTLPLIAPRATTPVNPTVAPLPVSQSPRTLTTAPLPTLPVRSAQTSPDAPSPVLPAHSVNTQSLAPTAPTMPVRSVGAGSSGPAPVAPRGQSSAQVGVPGPAPVAIASGGPAAATGVPVPVVGTGSHSGARSANSGTSGAPAPSRMEGSRPGGSSAGNSIAVAPRAGSHSGEGPPASAVANDNPHAPASTGAQRDVDFGAYMNELQRRIKRNWFPPRDVVTKRVMVVFSVGRDGHPFNVRLERTSGSAIADNAALKAVERAAPFAPLPAGSPENVDIQFTFDYNVFGGAQGTFRRF